MHRTSGPVRRSIVGVAIMAALLTACSDDAASEAEVRGVSIERDDLEEERAEHGSEDGQVVAETAREDDLGGVADLVLLRSGSLAVGTTWFAASGDWVGLDSQTLDQGATGERAHLDVVFELDGDVASIGGCTLRFAAPDDATFEAVGLVSAEVVIEDAAGVIVREPATVMDIEVKLLPGQTVDLDVDFAGDVTIDIGAGDAVQVHCEGRFDRA